MAYETEDLIDNALRVIEEHSLYFIKDVAAFMGIDRATFYAHSLDKNDTIKEALYKERVKEKVKTLSKWRDSKHPVLQMGHFKLIADEDQYHRLANTKFDITSRQEIPVFKGVNLDDDEELSGDE